MFSKLTIAFAVVFGLSSGAFAATKGHVRANAWYANAWHAYASAGPIYRSPDYPNRTWDPYGLRWD